MTAASIINVGDTVTATIQASQPPRIFAVRVTDVIKRYGRLNYGKTAMNPLVVGINIATGETECFDQSWVTDVTERARRPLGQPKNRYRDEVSARGAFVLVRGDRWESSLVSLAILALSKLPFEIDRPINQERLHTLYRKDRIGLVSSDERWGIYVVSAKRFKKWIRRHWWAILYTTRELTAQQSETNRRFEDDYWRGVERELEEDMDALEDDFDRAIEADAADDGRGNLDMVEPVAWEDDAIMDYVSHNS